MVNLRRAGFVAGLGLALAFALYLLNTEPSKPVCKPGYIYDAPRQVCFVGYRP